MMNSVLQRILNAELRVNSKHSASHMGLLSEYYRRMVLWGKALGCLNEWPYFDVAYHIDPSVRASDTDTEHLRQHLKNSPLRGGSDMQRILHFALHWAALKDSGVPIKIALPDPYEPITIMYERGGYFYTEHAFFVKVTEVAGFIFSGPVTYDRSALFITLDKATLDRIDADKS